jgi:TRAP-type uncharacterized transport system substrate-binding protein
VPQGDLNRPLAQEEVRTPSQRRALIAKLVLAFLLVGGLGTGISRLNLRRNIGRLDVAMLSGVPEGNYHHMVDDLSTRAAKEGGKLRNVASEGSAHNVRKLAAAAASCEVAVGVAQDGTQFGDKPPMLLGRLPKAESVLFFGKDADRLTRFSQLEHMKVGIGPDGSGAAAIAHTIFDQPELKALGLQLSYHSLAEQLDLAAKGELDLAVVVMDEDAALVKRAVLEQGLQIAGFDHVDVIARRIPHLRNGRISAGTYDAVKMLPKEDKRVMRVETLVIANACAGRSQIIDVLMLLSKEFPEFIRHNKDTPNATGLELSPTSREFFEQGGPELADEYVPWLVDVMPPANWAYVVMGVSLLFNAMGFGHRFRLWRIDAARVALESQLTQVFGQSTTVGDIAKSGALTAQQNAQVARIVTELEDLSLRSRRYSLSVLVPMGQEMAYRYQEEVIHQTLAVLHELQRRSAPAPAAAIA